jgi:D-alanyl-D-alanine carboxypeptidase/D-alanyl-D-alanine-endopeptidase (penicillin-binding protein 4)
VQCWIWIASALLWAALGGVAFAADVPAAAGVPWTPAQIASLDAEIALRLAAPALKGAHIGLYAIDAARGTVLYARAPDEAFVPASTLKLVTGSAALGKLGGDFRFRTSLFAPQPDGDTVRGDVILRGGGDPLLRASDLSAAAAALAAEGVKTVAGGLALDVSAFDRVPYAPGWMMEDVPYDFSAIVGGLMLEENTVTVHVAATAPGAPATLGLTPLTSAVTLENAVATGAAGSEDTVDVERDGAALRVTGSIPAGKEETLAASVPDPAAYITDVFARALAAHGVTFDPPLSGAPLFASAPAAAVPVWTHDSDPLAQLLKWFWYRSDNLVGETLVKTLGLTTAGAPGTTRNGVAYELGFLRAAGIDPASLAIVDGSGLSRYDEMTPRAYVTLLQADWNGPNRQTFLAALPHPVAGADGVYAKSGSMTHVWNLAGFALTQKHGPVTFAFLTDDYVGSVEALRATQAAIFARITGA